MKRLKNIKAADKKRRRSCPNSCRLSASCSTRIRISRYELENYEADDIIGTIAKSAEKDGFEVKILTGDKDLTQLATEGTTVAITKKGITDVEYYTPEHVREKYGLTPEQIIDMKGLMGDSSDNIPGVPGVGEKTAIKLLKQFHTVEELLSSIDEVSGKKLKEKLEEFKEQALMSKELATITTEAPLEVSLDSLGYEGFDREAVVKLFKDLGFHSLLERIGEEPGEKEEEQFEETMTSRSKQTSRMICLRHRLHSLSNSSATIITRRRSSVFRSSTNMALSSFRKRRPFSRTVLKSGPKTSRRRNGCLMQNEQRSLCVGRASN